MSKINVVIPCFDENQSIQAFHKKLTETLLEIPKYSFHLTYINDGSTDGTGEILEKLIANDKRFNTEIVNFSRNFGKEKALTAGLNISEDYDAVICIDGDLQHPPGKIHELIKEWENGNHIVTAVRSSTQDARIVKNFFSNLFYFLMKKFSSINLEKNSTDFGLYSKTVIKKFNQFDEKQRIFRGLISWIGFKRKNVYFTAIKDQKKKMSYTFSKLFLLAVDGLTSFSLFPIYLIFFSSLSVLLLTFFLILYMAYNFFFSEIVIFTPFAIMVVLNTFLVSLVLMSLGLISIYIGTIYLETKKRPLYVIENIKKNF
jgi:polyisoprenyl-phosphate glycosyltransferase